MFGDSPELNAYRQEMTRRRQASRSPRFVGNKSTFGPSISRRGFKAMDALMGLAADAAPLTQGPGNDLNRLF